MVLNLHFRQINGLFTDKTIKKQHLHNRLLIIYVDIIKTQSLHGL